MKCSECGSYKVRESNIQRGIYYGGITGLIVSPMVFNQTWAIIFMIIAAIGLIAMMADKQWKGVRNAGIFIFLLFLSLYIWMDLSLFIPIYFVGLVLWIVGYINRNKTAPKKYRCSSCGYEWREKTNTELESVST